MKFSVALHQYIFLNLKLFAFFYNILYIHIDFSSQIQLIYLKEIEQKKDDVVLKHCYKGAFVRYYSLAFKRDLTLHVPPKSPLVNCNSS